MAAVLEFNSGGNMYQDATEASNTYKDREHIKIAIKIILILKYVHLICNHREYIYC